SVVTTWPPWARTTVAVDDGCRPPANTQAPADCTSLLKASTAWKARCISSAGGRSSPAASALYTASRYCFIVVLPSSGPGPYRLSLLFTNSGRPNRHPAAGNRARWKDHDAHRPASGGGRPRRGARRLRRLGGGAALHPVPAPGGGAHRSRVRRPRGREHPDPIPPDPAR